LALFLSCCSALLALLGSGVWELQRAGTSDRCKADTQWPAPALQPQPRTLTPSGAARPFWQSTRQRHGGRLPRFFVERHKTQSQFSTIRQLKIVIITTVTMIAADYCTMFKRDSF
jgi:hypothetical protein